MTHMSQWQQNIKLNMQIIEYLRHLIFLINFFMLNHFSQLKLHINVWIKCSFYKAIWRFKLNQHNDYCNWENASSSSNPPRNGCNSMFFFELPCVNWYLGPKNNNRTFVYRTINIICILSTLSSWGKRSNALKPFSSHSDRLVF